MVQASCIMRVSVLFVALVASSEAFTAPSSHGSSLSITQPKPSSTVALFVEKKNDVADAAAKKSFSVPAKVAAMTASIWAATTQISAAAGPDWGIFEGRTGSLLHPITMGSLLILSLYTALLGFQWRKQRTSGDEINALKKTLPDLQGASSVSAALEAAKAAETVDTARVNALTAALSTEQQIADIQRERKELAAANPRDRHFNQGALLAFLGTAFAIEGPLNTYARAGKLFPGPHLYAGAGLVFCWALAASMVPHMQKGNDTARTVHIGANLTGIALFVWQVTTGVPILLKVVELTSWP